MRRVHLVVLWHMHQPQYRDPESGRYVLPWTRLHALKDYWGMVELLREFPNFHATFNVVPALGMQLEEYASCSFKELWFSLAFKNTDELTREDKAEIISRAFQVNHERLMSRWPRFVELFEWSRPAGGAQALVSFTPRDWRDLQLLSQLAWMEESWLETDDIVSRLSTKGKDYTENDKAALKKKQLDFLGLVLPAYRDAAQRGQIEISTTPFYHPILPLVCDSDIARVANPGTPLPRRAFRRPEDAREQLHLAREYHERVFGAKPAGLWPSEGSVSDQARTIAAEEGFQWFGTDEGVLGRTLNVGFFRDGNGIPANADRLYKPWRVQLAGKTIAGLFRDHHLSDLVGFVYSRMDAKSAAADLHGRMRHLGEYVPSDQPLTICLFLDGENAWEYYPGNGRAFLREFYGRIQGDQDASVKFAEERASVARVVFPGIFAVEEKTNGERLIARHVFTEMAHAAVEIGSGGFGVHAAVDKTDEIGQVMIAKQSRDGFSRELHAPGFVEAIGVGGNAISVAEEPDVERAAKDAFVGSEPLEAFFGGNGQSLIGDRAFGGP